MVTRLYQFPTFRPLLTKKVFQPFEASSLTWIMDEASAGLVAFDYFSFFAAERQLMNRNLVFPLRHRFPFLFQMDHPRLF